MTVFLPLLLAFLLGFGVACLLPDHDSRISLPERLALAYPLGLGLITMQMFLLGIARIPLQLVTVAPLIVAEIVIIYFLACRQKAVIFQEHDETTLHSYVKKVSRLEYLLTVLLILWILLKTGTVFVETYLRPIFSFDTFTNWSVRAKAYYYSGSLLLNPSAPDFFGRGISHSLSNFPPMNPLAQMWMAQWLGSFDEVLVKFWSPLFLVSAIAYLYLLAAKELNRLLALLIVVMFISSPLVSIHATETMSDLPLAVYILFAHYALLNVSRSKLAYLPLVGIFSAMAMFLKAEGIFISIPLFLACCFVLRTGRNAQNYSLKAVSTPFLLPYLLIAPWFIFKLVYNLGIGPDPSSRALYFNPVIILEYVTDFLTLQNFNVILIFLPICLFLCRKMDRELIVMGLPLFIYALFFLSLYVFIAYYADYSAGYSTNVFRNAMTFYPAVCLLLVLLIKRLLTHDAHHD